LDLFQQETNKKIKGDVFPFAPTGGKNIQKDKNFCSGE